MIKFLVEFLGVLIGSIFVFIIMPCIFIVQFIVTAFITYVLRNDVYRIAMINQYEKKIQDSLGGEKEYNSTIEEYYKNKLFKFIAIKVVVVARNIARFHVSALKWLGKN